MADDKTGTLAVQLPGVNFELLAKQVIAEKVAEGLFKSEQIVDGLVAEALTVKVRREDGQLDKYNSRDAMSWLEYVVQDQIKKTVVETVKRRIHEMQPRLEKAVAKALRDSADASAQVLVADFVERAKSTYGPSIAVTLTAGKRDR